MIADAVEAAARVIIASDAMTPILIAAMASAWLAAGALQLRFAVPSAPVRECLSLGSRFSGTRSLRRIQANHNDELVRASTATIAAVSGLLACISAILLIARGHTPSAAPFILPLAWLLLGAGAVSIAWLALGARSTHPGKAREWLARRGPHLILASFVGEAAIISATALTAMAMAHTSGVMISPLEAAAAAAIARVLTLLPFPPWGLGIADAALILTLIAIGSPESAAIATAILWRVVMLTLRFASFRSRRVEIIVGSDVTRESSLGRVFHRCAFSFVACLPPRLSFVARRRIFEMMFSMSDDPWQYDALPYEARKRERLISCLPIQANTIVEIGCADGHNVQALALSMPNSTIIGIDISPRAVQAARSRTRDQGNVIILQADISTATSHLEAAGYPTADVLIFSEVLYYLGTPSNLHKEVTHLQSVLNQNGMLLMLHPTEDAPRLHSAACEALGVTQINRVNIDDTERPYTIDIGTRIDDHERKEVST